MKGRDLIHILGTLVLVLFVATAATAQDGVAVDVTPGPNPGEVTIAWSGGQPLFEIFRSASPDNVVDGANKIGETTDRMFIDTPPAGVVFFYKVSSPCVSDPPEVCDGVDNDCDGEVDEAGAEDSCIVANAGATCVAGGCAVDLCDTGFDDCDLDPVNGCEVDLDSDEANCGACGNLCALANAGSECARGGSGGRGGDGGAGGSGAGGPSLGLARIGTSAPVWTDLSFDIGPVGAGGVGDVEGAPGLGSSIYPTYCGNGFVDIDRDMNEECDDGNTVTGDGCDAECLVEPGWSCRGSECGRVGTAVFVHEGNTDPNIEGWTRNDGPSGTSTSPVSADLGLNAWNIDDFSTGSGTRLTYSRDVAEVSPHVADASANGWMLRLRLRIVNVPDSLDFSVYSEYANGAHRWFLYFGNDSGGHPIAAILGGSSVTLSDLDDGYHWYELVYDPDAGAAKLYVDGVLRTSGPGDAISLTRVNFGSGQSASTGSGNYAHVEWFPLSCGNGTVDTDDNLNDGDGCSAICTLD